MKKSIINVIDILAVVGLAMLAAGLYLISLPLMLIVVGSILLSIGFIGAWGRGETIGSLPLILYEKQGNYRRRAVDYPLYSILHDSPNEMMTALEFKEAMQGNL